MISDWLDRFQERARRMGQMMHRMQVDMVWLARSRHGGDIAKVRSVCAGCRSTERCDRAHELWIAGRDCEPPEAYCPNARLLAGFREQS